MTYRLKTLLVFGGILSLSSGAQAITLAQALSKAYQSNPVLSSQRAQVRVTDEGVIQAKSGFLPGFSGKLQGDKAYVDSPSSSRYTTKTASGQLQGTYNVFSGGSTIADIKRTKADVMAARAKLMATEQEVLTAGIKAFMDVLTNRKIVEFNRANVRVLEEQYRATEVRVGVGDLTKSNAYQVLADVENARAQLTSAESSLEVSEANYLRVFGETAPQDIEFPGILPKTPQGLSETLDLARAYNPNVMQAKYVLDSSKAAVTREKGGLLPSFDLGASVGRRNALQGPSRTTVRGRTDDATFTASINIPIYDKGVSHSKVRSAMETKTRSKMDLEAAHRVADEAARQATAELSAALKNIEKFDAKVKAARTALEGIREEQRVGSRTTLEVLDAEQKHFEAQIEYAKAQRDKILATYAILSAVGALNATSLKLDVDYYDPTLHYENGRWIGWASQTDADFLVKRPGETKAVSDQTVELTDETLEN